MQQKVRCRTAAVLDGSHKINSELKKWLQKNSAFSPLFFSIFLFSALFFSCASNKSKESGNFYQENIGDFVEFSLSNGIPVVLKNISSEKNIELRLLFEGGASTCAAFKSGIDLLTFELLATNAALKEKISHGQYFPINSCANDFSTYGFSCAAAAFEETLELFAQSVLDPQYSHQDYLRLESAAANDALDRSENARFVLLDAVNETLLKGHPYYEGIYYKLTNRISEYDIEENLSTLLNARRIRIIAAGNFSLQKTFSEITVQVQQKLEELFGAISVNDFAVPEIPAINFSEKKDATINFDFAEKSYYAALCYACPSRGAQDYEPFALGTLVLDYVLRRDVVEKSKIASSCGTAVLNGKESLALIVAIGSNENRNVKDALSSALNAFPTEEELMPILDMFKNMYASKIYSSQKEEYATLDQIASSIYYQGSATAYLKRIEKIQKTTAAQVAAAYKKYFLTDKNLFVQVKN